MCYATRMTDAPVPASTPHFVDRYDWLNYGIANGWISAPFCYTHDQAPMTEAEAEEFDEGWDPCITALRVNPDIDD